MRRADRLFQIVQYLRGGRLLTAFKLAERLEVSERTIYRDIADLIGSGVPIEGEAGVGYLMRAGYDLPPLMFNRDEIVALVTGARLVKAWGGASMALAAEEALIKINAVLPEAEREKVKNIQIHAMTMQQMTDELRHLIDDLERAIDSRTRLAVSYQDANGTVSNRVLRPLGLWFWGKVWTLVAWCEMRQDFRMFRLDRISDSQHKDQFPMEPDKSLATFFARETRLGHNPEGFSR